MDPVFLWLLGGVFVGAAAIALVPIGAALSRGRSDPDPMPSHTESLFSALRAEQSAKLDELRGEINLIRQEWQGTLDQLVHDRENLAKQYRKLRQEARRAQGAEEPDDQGEPEQPQLQAVPSAAERRKSLNRRRRA